MKKIDHKKSKEFRLCRLKVTEYVVDLNAMSEEDNFEGIVFWAWINKKVMCAFGENVDKKILKAVMDIDTFALYTTEPPIEKTKDAEEFCVILCKYLQRVVDRKLKQIFS